jgi:hypothetical protein
MMRASVAGLSGAVRSSSVAAAGRTSVAAVSAARSLSARAPTSPMGVVAGPRTAGATSVRLMSTSKNAFDGKVRQRPGVCN